MINEFKNNAEIYAEKSESLLIFSGVKLLHIRRQIEIILGNIGSNGIFDQYTKHNISHIDEMLKMLDWLIPEETKNIMTPAEWMMLVLSIYFHDMGMLVTKKEYENRNGKLFDDYKNNVYFNNVGSDFYNKVDGLGEDKDRFLYQEYVRKNHASRVRKWIQGEFEIEEGECSSIVNEISDLLKDLDSIFKEDLSMICESHHLNDLDNYDKYDTKKRYGSSDLEVVNLQYIAVILRTADLLHITRDRTPAIEYRLTCPTDPISIIEWQKQMAIRAVVPKEKTDDKGNIISDLQKDTVEITAYFEKSNQAESFFALMDYLKYAREELKNSYEVIQNAMTKQGTKKYIFPWLYIYDESIKTKDFERNLLKFDLNQSNILQMLVGHTLYNDSSVVFRELVQNGLDAIKLQNEIEIKNSDIVTSGRININFNSKNKILEILDNGTGMTNYDIENYLLKIGTSKYSTKDFTKKFPDFVSISRFGIGILTCFLIANDVEILTNSMESEKANLITLRNVDGKYLLKKEKKQDLPEAIRKHGTSIKLHIRDEIDLDNIKNDLKRWIVFPYCGVFYKKDQENEVRIGYASPKEAIENYLSQGMISNRENILVKEEMIDGITMAYALRYSEYLQEYALVEFDRIGYEYDEASLPVPIGVCFEGIRVSDYTPGFKKRNLLAIINSKNCKIAQTNVARSSIEDNQSKEKLLKIIYSIYKNYVLEQINMLKNRNFSLAWISYEIKYLIQPIFFPNRDSDIYNDDVIENIDILREVFCEIDGILYEEDGERRLVSAKYLQGKSVINYLESNLMRAAEWLLRETKSNITLKGLGALLSSDSRFDVNNLMCDFDSGNIMHVEAIKNKYAFVIHVQRDERKIDITYRGGDNPWIDIVLLNMSPFRISGKIETLHIPVNLEEELIIGLTDEFGVKTKGGVYLSANHFLTKYIVQKMALFQYKESETEMKMLRVFLSFFLNRRILNASNGESQMGDIEQYFYTIIERENMRSYSTEVTEGLWTKIDKNEFLSNLFAEKNIIFDTANWSRFNGFDD